MCRSVSTAWAPIFTAPAKAPIVFSGCSALYPRWAIVCGIFSPPLVFRANVHVATRSVDSRRRHKCFTYMKERVHHREGWVFLQGYRKPFRREGKAGEEKAEASSAELALRRSWLRMRTGRSTRVCGEKWGRWREGVGCGRICTSNPC